MPHIPLPLLQWHIAAVDRAIIVSHLLEYCNNAVEYAMTEYVVVTTGKLTQCLVFLKMFIRPMDALMQCGLIPTIARNSEEKWSIVFL